MSNSSNVPDRATEKFKSVAIPLVYGFVALASILYVFVYVSKAIFEPKPFPLDKMQIMNLEVFPPSPYEGRLGPVIKGRAVNNSDVPAYRIDVSLYIEECSTSYAKREGWDGIGVPWEACIKIWEEVVPINEAIPPGQAREFYVYVKGEQGVSYSRALNSNPDKKKKVGVLMRDVASK